VQVPSSYLRYFFEKETHAWVQLDFSEGLYRSGHSLRVTKMERVVAENFYAGLIAPGIQMANQGHESEWVINQY
jgi:hypothetical protein